MRLYMRSQIRALILAFLNALYMRFQIKALLLPLLYALLLALFKGLGLSPLAARTRIIKDLLANKKLTTKNGPS